VGVGDGIGVGCGEGVGTGMGVGDGDGVGVGCGVGWAAGGGGVSGPGGSAPVVCSVEPAVSVGVVVSPSCCSRSGVTAATSGAFALAVPFGAGLAAAALRRASRGARVAAGRGATG
jgi:hypothetical protein